MNIIIKLFLSEYTRWILWSPVGLGIGIAIYFLLPQEPWIGLGALLCLKCSLLGYFLKRYSLTLGGIFLVLSVISLGFTSAQIRTLVIVNPMLDRKLPETKLQGELTGVEHKEHGVRLTFKNIQGDLPQPLQKIRLTWRGSELPTLSPGMVMTFRAVLLPPSDPSTPGAFDFRRQAYFEGIGAVGFITTKAADIQITTTSNNLFSIAGLRHRINERLKILPGQVGAIAIALITGDKTALTKDTREAFAGSGLAHVLAISGLHLSIVAGLIFLVVRRGLSILPIVPLRYPIKKWAAVLGILATAFYLAISGFGYPAQRSFIMTAVVMGAILIDRTALSMRSVSLAALILLLLRPESLLTASFQLSFAAVVTLIAVYEGGQGRLQAIWVKNQESRLGFMRTPLFYIMGILVTTLVATLATTPYTIGIFNKFTLQSFASNLAAIPLVTFWIMPWAVVSVLAMTFGLESFPLSMMGLGIEGLSHIAHTIALWPGANIPVPPPSAWFIPLITLGGLWLCLWRGVWRYWGFAPMVVAFGTLGFHQAPDILLSPQGPILGIGLDSKILWVSDPKIKDFTKDIWMKEFPRGQVVSDSGAIHCETGLCQTMIRNHKVVWTGDVNLMNTWCQGKERATLAISLEPFKGRCLAAQRTLNLRTLWNQGSIYVWLGDPLLILSAAPKNKNRSWTRRRGYSK